MRRNVANERNRLLGFIEAMKFVGKSDEEIVAAVKEISEREAVIKEAMEFVGLRESIRAFDDARKRKASK